MTEPKQWAIEQHIKKNPKCEWLCTHTKLENLGEQPEDRPITEPTIDELVEMCFDDLCINNTGNYIRITFGDKSMNVDYEHFLAFRKRIEALISNQVAKARIDELENMSGCPPILVESTIKDRIKELGE